MSDAIQKMIEQARERSLERKRKRAATRCEGTSTNGRVTAEVDALRRLMAVRIDPELLREATDDAGRGQLEKSIAEASNAAMGRIRELLRAKDGPNYWMTPLIPDELRR